MLDKERVFVYNLNIEQMFLFEWRFEYADEICGRSRGDRVYGQGREIIAAKDRSARYPRRVGIFDLLDERGTEDVS